MVCSPNHDTNLFNIITGVLQGDILAPYMFIIHIDYVLQTSIDLIKVNSFTLEKIISRWYPIETITDTIYTDDLRLLTNTPTQAESLLHNLEQVLASIWMQIKQSSWVLNKKELSAL